MDGLKENNMMVLDVGEKDAMNGTSWRLKNNCGDP